jgi:hypothetical protein
MPPGSSRKDVVRMVINNYLIFEDPGVISVPAEIYERGISLIGKAMYVLSKLSLSRAYIETESINIVGDENALIGFLSVLSSETGLLGTPKKYQAFLEASVIFEPSLILSQGIELQSSIDPRWNGHYKIVSLKHSGTISGSMGSACTTTLQMRMGEFNAVSKTGSGSTI